MKRIAAGMLTAAVVMLMTASGANAAPVDKKIERLWKAKCSSCHGMDGKGATQQGQKMKTGPMGTPEWQKENTDAKIKEAITKGLKREKDGVKQEMDAFKLAPAELDGLIVLMRTFTP